MDEAGGEGGGSMLAWDDRAPGASFDASDGLVYDRVERHGLEGAP
jgi:hypothetical protein